MKSILKFNLEDYQDQLSLSRCLKATDMALAIRAISYNLKKDARQKLDVEKFKTPEDLNEYIFDNINDIIYSYDINIDELLE